jgi:metallo-beta-lactamase family protein
MERDEICEGFKEEIIQMGYTASAPYSGARFDFLASKYEVEEGPVPFKKTYAAEKADNMFNRLLAAGRRLMNVIDNNKGGSNKDLARFADQINSLCDRWDR